MDVNHIFKWFLLTNGYFVIRNEEKVEIEQINCCILATCLPHLFGERRPHVWDSLLLRDDVHNSGGIGRTDGPAGRGRQ